VFMRHIPNTKPEQTVNISTRTMQEIHGQMPLFIGELERWKNAEYSVVVIAPDEERAQKIQSILKEYGAELPVIENLEFTLGEPAITVGRLSKGIELPESKLAIITENEFFKKNKKHERKQQNIKKDKIKRNKHTKKQQNKKDDKLIKKYQ